LDRCPGAPRFAGKQTFKYKEVVQNGKRVSGEELIEQLDSHFQHIPGWQEIMVCENCEKL